MAFVHGKDSVFKLDNSGGSLTDISTYVNSVDFPETVGLKDATLSISGLWDSTLDGILGAVVGQSATLSFEYSPEGTGSGAVQYTGECILTSYSQSSPVGDVVGFSADMQVSGDVTRATH